MKLLRILFVSAALSSTTNLNTWGMDDIIHIDQRHIQCQQSEGIEKAAAAVIDYIKVGLKNYTGGPTLPRESVSEIDPLCDIYLDLANQFTLAGAKREDVLPVWTDLAHVFLEVAKVTLTTEQQKKEYLIFEEELSTYKKKNYTWYCLYMHAMATLVTHPKNRSDVKYINTRFDHYQVAVEGHFYKDQPAWLSHEGRMDAYLNVGSEWTRNVASTLAQTKQFPDVVFLWCPFELSPSDLIITRPHPEYSHLWFIGFALGPVSVDGVTLQPNFFSRHDEQHKVIEDRELSGFDHIFTIEDEKDLPSPKVYWEYVREGRMIWYDCVKMFRDFTLSILKKKQKSDEDIMSEVFTFYLSHEGSGSHQVRIKMIFGKKTKYTSSPFQSSIDTSLFLDPHYYFPLLPASLQEKKSNVTLFSQEIDNYIDVFHQRIAGALDDITKKYVHNPKNRIISDEFFKNLPHGVDVSFDVCPYNPRKERVIGNKKMLEKYGFHYKLYQYLSGKKSKNQKIFCAQYDFRSQSNFYMKDEPPFYDTTLSDQDEISENEGLPMFMCYAAIDFYEGKEKFELLEKAYILGFTPSLAALGAHYYYHDKKKGIEFLKKGAEEGDQVCLNIFEQIVASDLDLTKDYEEAKELFRNSGSI